MKVRLAALLVPAFAIIATPACAQGEALPADESAVFIAAGFAQQDGKWSKCGDPGTASYTPGQIEAVGDLNSDGQPEALVTESSAYCFGNTGTGYTLVSRQADGSWKVITEGEGVPTTLETRGVDGWPDIQVGGPGFCHPVERWNGTGYELNRHEYEGKSCKPEGI
jgi:hypothetical protein